MANCIVVSVIKSTRFSIGNACVTFSRSKCSNNFAIFCTLGKLFYFIKTSIALSLFTALLLVVEKFQNNFFFLFFTSRKKTFHIKFLVHSTLGWKMFCCSVLFLLGSILFSAGNEEKGGKL